jgi:hypothetical protein
VGGCTDGGCVYSWVDVRMFGTYVSGWVDGCVFMWVCGRMNVSRYDDE